MLPPSLMFRAAPKNFFGGCSAPGSSPPESVLPEDGTSSISYGDWEYSYHIPTQEEVATLKELISVAEPSSATGNDEITNIITEEAEAFFKGQKSVADVAKIIQGRVQVYVNENR